MNVTNEVEFREALQSHEAEFWEALQSLQNVTWKLYNHLKGYNETVRPKQLSNEQESTICLYFTCVALVFCFVCHRLDVYCQTRQTAKTHQGQVAKLANGLSNDPILIDGKNADAKNDQKIKTNAQVQFVKPDYWSNDVPDGQVLSEITPCDDEYWIVDGKLKQEMPDAHLSLLFRVQNPSMWSYYCFHQERLSMCSIDHNEKEVWHGTRLRDPSVIYNNPLDGFMMQFAREGCWGRGIYFAEKSSYSDEFAYKNLEKRSSVTDRPLGHIDEREMFLAKLLVGKSVKLDGDKTLAFHRRLVKENNDTIQ